MFKTRFGPKLTAFLKAPSFSPCEADRFGSRNQPKRLEDEGRYEFLEQFCLRLQLARVRLCMNHIARRTGTLLSSSSGLEEESRPSSLLCGQAFLEHLDSNLYRKFQQIIFNLAKLPYSLQYILFV